MDDQNRPPEKEKKKNSNVMANTEPCSGWIFREGRGEGSTEESAPGSNCGLAKGGCYLDGGGTGTGLKSRRYLLSTAVTSFNSYQFHGHTSLPVDTMVTSGELGPRPRTSIHADDKYLIVREKEVYWTPVETGTPMPISTARGWTNEGATISLHGHKCVCVCVCARIYIYIFCRRRASPLDSDVIVNLGRGEKEICRVGVQYDLEFLEAEGS